MIVDASEAKRGVFVSQQKRYVCTVFTHFPPSSFCYQWRRAWPPTPIFFPGGFHGQRSLAGYSPQGRKESDMTEATWHTQRHLLLSEKGTYPRQVKKKKKNQWLLQLPSRNSPCTEKALKLNNWLLENQKAHLWIPCSVLTAGPPLGCEGTGWGASHTSGQFDTTCSVSPRL